MWQKVFDEETWYPLSDGWNFLLPEILWYTEVFPNEIFCYCETKNFERKVVNLLFCIECKKSVVELMFVENFRKLDFKQ